MMVVAPHPHTQSATNISNIIITIIVINRNFIIIIIIIPSIVSNRNIIIISIIIIAIIDVS